MSEETPLFGEAAAEADAGYTPMPGPETEVPVEYATAREAADALAEQEQADPTPIVYHNRETGERLNDDLKEGLVETVKLERAADDLSAYEANVVDNRAKSISSEFAQMVDGMRAEAVKTNPELAKEFTPPAEEKPVEQNTTQADSQPDPIDSVDGLEEETRKALKIPQVRQAIEQQLGQAEQVRQTYSTALSSANAFARANFFEAVPELSELPPEQIERGLAVLAEVDPPRFQKAIAALNRVGQIQTAMQQEQQKQAQIAHQQFEARRQEYSAKTDEVLGPMTWAQRAELADELVSYVGDYGVTKDQLIEEAKTNLALHHPAFQKMAVDAIKYRRMMNATKARPHTELPTVQKPGVSGPKSSPATDIRALQRQLSATTSESKQLKIARQILNLQNAG